MDFFRILAFLLLLAPPQSDGTTTLHNAVVANDLPAVQKLLRSGANPGAANRYGITPLSLAAESGNVAVFEALIKAGADPKVTLPGGQTLLMTAARTGNPEIVRMLLERGADPNATEDTDGETALMWAAAQNHPEAIQVLVMHGAEVNTRSKSLTYKTDRFGLEGVLTILPRGSLAALMIAAREGSLGAARALAESGSELDLTDPDGTTALVFAIINNHYDTAAMLLGKGANPNIGDSAGMAALYAAVDMNTLIEIYGRPARKTADHLSGRDLILKLLENGANPNAQLKAPALQRAHTPGDRNLGEGATPLMRAARNGDSPAMRLLLEHGAEPAIAQKNHVTALMLAAGLGRGLGTFADEYAAEKEQYDAVKLLLDRRVDVNAANDGGQTALHFAALSMDSVVELLVMNGANLEAKDRQGRTPLDMASGKGGPGRAGAAAVPRPGTIALLRKLGAR
ncbi:MAG TPA: ankyrin repeat domain-containing protein [Terriglobia bacterium]|jgi:ankyrin repeat protein